MNALAASITLATLASLAGAQCEVDKLVPSSNAAGDWLGWTLDAGGDVVAVSAQFDDETAADAGCVHIYQFDGAHWTRQEKITAPDGAEGDQFGESVAVCGDALVVGVHRHDSAGDTQGAVYVFRRGPSGWALEQKLDNPDPVGSREAFGYEVDIDGDVLVASAIWDVNDDGKTGAAYVFRFDGVGWNLQTKLTPPDGEAGANFGQDIALSGSTLVVGSPFSDAAGVDSGAAWVYRFDGAGWQSQGRLVPATAQPQNYVGASVSVSGGTIALGAWNRGHSGTDLWDGHGGTFVYDRAGSAWAEAAEILPPSAEPAQGFSSNALTLAGDTLLIGAMGDAAEGAWTGAVHVYRRIGGAWAHETTIRPTDAEGGDYFGSQPQLARGQLLVGMAGDEDSGLDSGSVRVFQLAGCDPCPADFNSDGTVNTLDVLSFLNAWNAGCP